MFLVKTSPFDDSLTIQKSTIIVVSFSDIDDGNDDDEDGGRLKSLAISNPRRPPGPCASRAIQYVTFFNFLVCYFVFVFVLVLFCTCIL